MMEWRGLRLIFLCECALGMDFEENELAAAIESGTWICCDEEASESRTICFAAAASPAALADSC